MAVAILHKSKNVQIAFAGELKDKNLINALTEASITGSTGIFYLKTPKNEYRFYFVKGSMVYSTEKWQSMETTVMNIVKYSGFISREKLIYCERQKSKTLKTVLEMLVDDGYISMMLYSKIISIAMRINIINAMLETEGTFSFEIKYKLDTVQGVKPVAITYLKPVEMLIDEHRQDVQIIMNSLYSKIGGASDASYMDLGHSFLYNAIIAESDFLRFFTNAAKDFAENKWTFQTLFHKDQLWNTISVYTFRTLVVVSLIVFLYLSFMTTTLDVENDDIRGMDFYFIQNKIASSFTDFQNRKEIPDSTKKPAKKLKVKTQKTEK